MRRHQLPAMSLALLVGGCASLQLNNNTNDISSHFESLYTSQALENLSSMIDNQYAIPSQIDVTGGTVQTVNTVNPSLTIPFTSQVMETVTNSAAQGLSLAGQRTNAAAGATLSATNTQQQNYNVVPIIDANTLRNLQAIYRYALYGSDILKEYHPARVYFDNMFFFDPYQLKYPQCVLCANPTYGGQLDPDIKLHVNESLRSTWVYWEGGPLPPQGAPIRDLGHYGNHELYMLKADYDAGVLSKFIYFIMPNQQPAETFTAVLSRTPPSQPEARKSGVSKRPPAKLGAAGPAGAPTTPPQPAGPRGPVTRRNYLQQLQMQLVYPPTVPTTNDHVSGPGRPLQPPVLPGIQP